MSSEVTMQWTHTLQHNYHNSYNTMSTSTTQWVQVTTQWTSYNKTHTIMTMIFTCLSDHGSIYYKTFLYVNTSHLLWV